MGNAIIERFHRSLKQSLMAKENPQWTVTLPMTMLGLRTALKPDIGASAAELVYGCSLRFPGDFVETKAREELPTNDYVREFVKKMQQIQPRITSDHSKKKNFVSSKLDQTPYVLIRGC